MPMQLLLVIMPVPHLVISWKIMMLMQVRNFLVYTRVVATVFNNAAMGSEIVASYRYKYSKLDMKAAGTGTFQAFCFIFKYG